MNALENYPHVIRRIEELWGSMILNFYISKLFLQERTEHRQGFSPDAFRQLLFVAETHKMIYGH